MLDTIMTRRSVRQWGSQPIGDTDIRDLLDAAMNAPSAVNEQAWQFVVLTGTPLQQVLSVNNNTPSGAPVGILVCKDLRHEKVAGYAVQDCSAATQNILLAAHAKGLGAVWTTVFPKNNEVIQKKLALPAGVVPFSLVPIGYPATERTKPTSRFDAAKVHTNSW